MDRAVAAATSGLRGLAPDTRAQARRDPLSRGRSCWRSARSRSRATSRARWARCWWRRAATCRKPSTWPTTWPARDAASSASSCPPSCRTRPPMAMREPHRRRRLHHALELPRGHPQLEDDGRADRRQHRRPQARHRHAALRRQLRARSSRTLACRRACSISSCGSGAEVGMPLVQHPDVAAHLVHRLERGGPRGQRRGGARSSSASRWSWAARTPSS